MRALFGLLCFVSVAPDVAAPDPDGSRAQRLSEVASLLTEISSRRADGEANGLPDDLASAVDGWTGEPAAGRG